MPRAGAVAVVKVRGANGSRNAGYSSGGSIRDARSSRWRRRAGRGSITESVRLARRQSRSAIFGEWRDAEFSTRFRSGIYACPSCRVQSITLRMVRTATDRRRDVDTIRTLQNHRYARAGPSIVEYRRWMRVRAAASLECARMMHYPREMLRRRVTPACSAGDRGLTEAWGRPEMRRYGD